MGRERSNSSSSSNKKTGSNQSVRGTTREGYFGIEGRSRPIVAELAECAELERRGVLQPIGLFFVVVVVLDKFAKGAPPDGASSTPPPAPRRTVNLKGDTGLQVPETYLCRVAHTYPGNVMVQR